jgi:hypothetical protein
MEAMLMDTIALTLLEAQLTLYAAKPDGTPGAAIWSGAAAENFRAEGRWLNVETRPTGAAQPVNHPLVPQYQLSIERVWSLPLTNLNGFQATGQEYILQVVWTDEDTQNWHRRIYYGVTISAQSLASRDIDSGHTDNQEFLARYFVPDSGPAGTAPGAPAANPAYVLYWGVDGTSQLLYTYAGGVYTNCSDGSLATIAEDGSSIAFAGGSPVLATTASGLNVTGLHDIFPGDILPRLEFYAGDQLLAALTSDGLWARSYADDYAGGNGLFNFAYAGSPAAVLMPGVVIAEGFNTTD